MSDVLLLSGGLDSIAAWRLLGCPQAVHFAHGSAAEARERRALLWAVDQACASWGFDSVQLRGLLLPALDVQDNGYVPYRNAIFCLLAANSFPDATRIIVAQVAEWAPDKNLRFWRRLTKLMNEMTRSRSNEIDRRVKIVAPFAGLTKGQLLGRYADEFGLHEANDLIENTWSCYGDGARHCGECSGCLQRAQAERAAFGMVDFTHYTTFPDVRTHYEERARQGGIADGWRWLRGNGVLSLVARAREIW